MSQKASSNMDTTVTTFDEQSHNHFRTGLDGKKVSGSFLHFDHLEVSPDFGNKIDHESAKRS